MNNDSQASPQEHPQHDAPIYCRWCHRARAQGPCLRCRRKVRRALGAIALLMLTSPPVGYLLSEATLVDGPFAMVKGAGIFSLLVVLIVLVADGLKGKGPQREALKYLQDSNQLLP